RAGARPRYWLTLLSGMLECLCFAGAVFGFASLVFVLKAEGYFSQLCSGPAGSNSSRNGTDCREQDEQFSLVFTIASFLNNFLCLLNGYLFDRFGTMATRLLATCLYTSGTLLCLLPSAASSELLFLAAPCIAVGGILLLLTNMQVGNLFAAHRSTIITLYNGAFDSSSALFFIIKVLYEGGISLRTSFLVISSCSIIHLLRTLFLMPRSRIPYAPRQHYSYGLRCPRANRYEVEQLERRTMAEGQRPGGGDTASPGSFRSCVLSWFFLWHLLWLSIMQLRHFFFIGTLNPTLNRLARNDPHLVSRYTNAFAVAQLCGVLFAPWNGILMDRHKGRAPGPGNATPPLQLRSSCLSLFVTSLQGLLFSVCASIPLLPLQYLSFVLQVLNRSFLYGGNAAFISIAFPACHFGKLYGVAMSLSALVSLLQYPCFTLVRGPLRGDPFYVDVALTLLTLLVFVHPVYTFVRCRRLARRRAEGPATQA
uniref:Solute carrier family 43 member 3a n=1 Tax=Tetraodon nigroviridis TaxID=99883 RepID=H3D477_TETNG